MQTITPRIGPKDDITDIPGLKIGHAEDENVKTGVSVILPDEPCTMAVDVRGGGPGTRELEALDPSCIVSMFHGLVLSGGSVFGLEAASAAVNWLSAHGRGLPLTPRHVPVIPSAVLYDLANGGDKDWGEDPPYRRLARMACENASYETGQGSIGAGFGATSGSRKGGVGSASLITPDGHRIAALIIVNSFGEVMGETPPHDLPLPKAPIAGLNTTIGVVATTAKLDKGQAKRMAMMAQDGLARAIRPIHTPFDGDSIFAMATGEDAGVDSLGLTILGSLAADCVVKAVQRAVTQ